MGVSGSVGGSPLRMGARRVSCRYATRAKWQEVDMRLSKPRVAAARDEDLDDEGRELLQTGSREGRGLHHYRPLGGPPQLPHGWGVFRTHLPYHSTLPARQQ